LSQKTVIKSVKKSVKNQSKISQKISHTQYIPYVPKIILILKNTKFLSLDAQEKKKKKARPQISVLRSTARPACNPETDGELKNMDSGEGH
jgi:hypothetical protein